MTGVLAKSGWASLLDPVGSAQVVVARPTALQAGSAVELAWSMAMKASSVCSSMGQLGARIGSVTV